MGKAFRSSKSRHIVIVDSNDELREDVEVHLAIQGHSVVTHVDAKHYPQSRSDVPDLLVLNLDGDGMRGEIALAELSAQKRLGPTLTIGSGPSVYEESQIMAIDLGHPTVESMISVIKDYLKR